MIKRSMQPILGCRTTNHRVSSRLPKASIRIFGIWIRYKDPSLDMTKDGKIVGIEILDATEKIHLKSLFSCEYEPESILGKV